MWRGSPSRDIVALIDASLGAELFWLAKSLLLGIRRRLSRALQSLLSWLGAVWLLSEIAIASFSGASTWLQQNSTPYLVTMLVGSVAVVLRALYEPSTVTFTLPATPTRITLKFGDLFAQEGDLLIGVNEFFDHQIGEPVAPTSLHGQSIQRLFGGDERRFRQAVDDALTGVQGEPVRRSIEPKKRYPIGTTAGVPLEGRKLFLVAFTRTEPTTFKASSSVPDLWNAIETALKSTIDHGNGTPLSLPLIGNGRASINLEPQHLLRLLVLAIVEYGKKQRLPDQVAIILPSDCFEKLDIREIRRDWSMR